MWTENEVYREDLEYIASCNFINWQRFANKTVLVTGATGLIGSEIVNALLWYDKLHATQIQVVAMVRNKQKAMTIFSEQLKEFKNLRIAECSLTDPIELDGNVDYIVHTAAPTTSKFFIEHPAETIDTIFSGTKRILDFAVQKNVDAMVYLSSMEVYGTPKTDGKIFEDTPCNLNLESPRSCYPEGKRAAEALCIAYRKQYGLNSKVLRLTQTFGAGVSYDDQRVFAQFARCAIQHENIVLKTKGETKRSYLYTADAISAILAALVGKQAEILMNVANEDTYCSILEMAELVAQKYSICVEFDLSADAAVLGYAPVLKMNLDTSRIKKMGWSPNYKLAEMYERMISFMVEK